jgi:protocatechuate 3,4-dioxygenase beta subunit
MKRGLFKHDPKGFRKPLGSAPGRKTITPFPLLIVLLFFATSACSGQPAATTQPPVANVHPSPVVQVTAPELIPNTGLTSAAPTLPPLPAPVSTATAQPTLLVGQTLAPTAPAAAVPNCTAPAGLTPAVTEGPYFKAGSPETANLLKAGMPGVKLVLSGFVLTSGCQPVAHALLDFWQADSRGQYDNSGYTLRGHQYTDANGRYQLETVIPGLYPGRTEHIHVKVQAPGGRLLTTQLFFPGVANNNSDGIFDSHLLVTLSDAPGGKLAGFNFILP